MNDLFCTRGRDRTGTSVTSLVFETSASTNSATRALLLRAAKVKLFFIIHKQYFKKILAKYFFA